MNALNPRYTITLAGVQTLGPWQGVVHSVFNQAVNILVGQQRITLLSNPLWISEHNLVANSQHILSLIRPDSQLAIQQNILYLDGTALANLANTVVWQMPPLTPQLITVRAMQHVEQFLLTSPGDKLVQIIEQQSLQAMRAFVAGEPTSFANMIGAGYGLTPSGDDMLVGFALALCCYQPQRLTQLASACQPHLTSTTDISRYLLQDALAGKFSAPLLNLLLALQSEQQISNAITIAANIGSSSGRDGIWGLYQGIKLVNPMK